jgi:hypothetical protein
MEMDPLALALPVIAAGPQTYAKNMLESLYKSNPRAKEWFESLFRKQEAISESGLPVMGFHGTNVDFPLNEIRGGNSWVVDQALGPHFAVDPEVAKHFAIHKGYNTRNLDPDFEQQMSNWLHSAQDVGQGSYMSKQMPDTKYQAYAPVGGRIIPAFLKSENPYIIKQVYNPTEFMPKPTSMISRGADLRPQAPSSSVPEGAFMNDSNAVSRDFFNVLFQEVPQQRAVDNAKEWGRMNYGADVTRLKDLYDRGLLAEEMHRTGMGGKGSAHDSNSILNTFLQRYKGELRRKGHDSIMYHNTVEAPGELDPRTFIMFDTQNIVSPYDFEKLRSIGGWTADDLRRLSREVGG